MASAIAYCISRASIFFVDVTRKLSYSYEPLYVEISSTIGAWYDSSSAIYVHKMFRKRNEENKKTILRPGEKRSRSVSDD